MLLEREKTNRYSQFLRQRYRAILGYTGLICAIAGVVILSPLLALIFYPEEIGLAWGFALPGIALALLYRALLWEVKRMLQPRNTITEPDYWQGDRRNFLDDRQIRTIALFIFLYFVVFFLGVIITAAYGNSLPDSLFEYASSLSTVGLSIGVTAADAPVGLLWTQIIGMFLGRLEFFTVFIGIFSLFKDIPAIISKL